jgi:hypothetical protein
LRRRHGFAFCEVPEVFDFDPVGTVSTAVRWQVPVVNGAIDGEPVTAHDQRRVSWVYPAFNFRAHDTLRRSLVVVVEPFLADHPRVAFYGRKAEAGGRSNGNS